MTPNLAPNVFASNVALAALRASNATLGAKTEGVEGDDRALDRR
jgi:hypothetical protein